MPDIESIKKEYNELLEQLGSPELISNRRKGDESKNSSSPFAGARVFEELTKRKKFLEKIIEKQKEVEEIKRQIQENNAIVAGKEDLELSSLAEEELKTLLTQEKQLEKELESLLKNEGERESQTRQNFAPQNLGRQAVIVEIRAGAGGEESALFASDLFRMYSKYAQTQGWRQKILDSRPTEIGGVKEIIFELTPNQGPGRRGNVFSKMKYEGGVHRVQRIPTTEKSGRIHTSTASVAVLPKPQKAEIKINPQDLKIDFYRASGPGGQYVNKRETAVRITHLPTGLIVTSQTERNQLANKENALTILEAKLLETREEKEIQKLGEKRKTQIGRAKRAEKIRTYNFPQDRVTDHRIKKSWHHLEEIMAGRLEPIIETLQKRY